MPDVGRNKPAPAGVSGEEKRYALAGNARKRAYSGLRCVTSVNDTIARSFWWVTAHGNHKVEVNIRGVCA